MIHTFSVTNYQSIREEVVLDLRIPGTAPDLPRFRQSVAKPDVRLPSVVVLMGPNGSGKTTLLKALVETARIASSASPAEQNNPIESVLPFASARTMGEPTRFCVEVEADWLAPGEARRLFRYEVVVGRDGAGFKNCAFHYEALSWFPKGRPRRLFERAGPGEPIYVSGETGLKPRDERLKAVREAASVVATLALLNVPLAMSVAESARSLLLSSNILHHERWELPTRAVTRMLTKHPALRDWVEKYIRSSDLGIRDMSIPGARRPLSTRGGSSDLGIPDMSIPGDAGEDSVFFSHHGLAWPVGLYAESSGTKRLFHLLPQIAFAIDGGVPVVLDEVEGDLHVDVAGEVLGWFRSRETNPQDAQLFVSSHNVGLLDDLEKEELFIVEKDAGGATRVHGAQDVRGLRRDTRLYPKYRAGVLGGIPKIG